MNCKKERQYLFVKLENGYLFTETNCKYAHVRASTFRKTLTRSENMGHIGHIADVA